MWDLPGPGLKRVYPALTGGFLTTVPPGKSLYFISNEMDYLKKLHVPFNIMRDTKTKASIARVTCKGFQERKPPLFLKQNNRSLQDTVETGPIDSWLYTLP